jgi:hypothetical protein
MAMREKAKRTPRRIPARVVVPNVRIARGMVQKVIFLYKKAKHRYVAKTKGCPIIRIEVREDGKFHAWNGAVDVKDDRPDVAFARAVRHLWL